VPSHCPGQIQGRFSFWASNFSFSLGQWARDQVSCLPTKALKLQLRLAQGKQNLRATCPKGKLEFFKPWQENLKTFQ